MGAFNRILEMFIGQLCCLFVASRALTARCVFIEPSVNGLDGVRFYAAQTVVIPVMRCSGWFNSE